MHSLHLLPLLDYQDRPSLTADCQLRLRISPHLCVCNVYTLGPADDRQDLNALQFYDHSQTVSCSYQEPRNFVGKALQNAACTYIVATSVDKLPVLNERVAFNLLVSYAYRARMLPVINHLRIFFIALFHTKNTLVFYRPNVRVFIFVIVKENVAEIRRIVNT